MACTGLAALSMVALVAIEELPDTVGITVETGAISVVTAIAGTYDVFRKQRRV